ncbi:MAG: HlyD family efflux transporter periplasmic adaptor subunit [Gracilimonas sp.]|uniref:HlyD family secretion protein n=1 Tax=Gracilimonas TaxID=649462 RepID=UPI001B164F1B|nr:HlyD family efflux transporter periplasmic adaptor subunit [Gracilimonas sp.]MBO6587331.1 HlyD family efflux transporter periplasmic adaptor subunit [Gracilimonas sp.]MBO6614181.1 HlyD family efflux transporter periplasmic adaptor subunit [Gracilimonas sp.]
MLFPKEIFEQTTQSLSVRHTVSSQILYTATLCFLAGLFVSLPFIQVDVSVKSDGMIRANTERQVLKTAVSGIISEFRIKENNLVQKGDLLVSIDSEEIEQSLEYNRQRQSLLRNYIWDLKSIKRKLSESVEISLSTSLYHSEWLAFEQEKNDLEASVHNIESEYNRQKQLFDKQLISQAELEQQTFQLESEKRRLELLHRSKLNSWQQELDNFEQELKRLQAELTQLKKEKERHSLYAPVDGVIQNVAGISENSMIYVNEKIAEISPNTALIAELYVSARDIGLLKEGMQARFQINAFDHNQWGSLYGSISEISNDVIVIQDQPVFLVRCKLNQDFLELPNGYKGNLKKGMTLQGRFTVTERSLFQLLYDNVDDWLNPA